MKRLVLAWLTWYQTYGTGALAALLPLGAVSGCRQVPTCSAYARTEIEARGVLRGAVRALWRALLCNPLTNRVH